MRPPGCKELASRRRALARPPCGGPARRSADPVDGKGKNSAGGGSFIPKKTQKEGKEREILAISIYPKVTLGGICGFGGGPRTDAQTMDGAKFGVSPKLAPTVIPLCRWRGIPPCIIIINTIIIITISIIIFSI